MQVIKRGYIVTVIILTTLFAVSCRGQETAKINESDAGVINETTNEQKNTKFVLSNNNRNLKQTNVEQRNSCDFSSLKIYDKKPTTQFEEIPQPTYPKKVRKIKGKVVVQVLVNKDGRVEKACVIKGNSTLSKLAVEAAMNIKINAEYARRILTATNNDYFSFPVVYNFSK